MIDWITEESWTFPWNAQLVLKNIRILDRLFDFTLPGSGSGEGDFSGFRVVGDLPVAGGEDDVGVSVTFPGDVGIGSDTFCTHPGSVLIVVDLELAGVPDAQRIGQQLSLFLHGVIAVNIPAVEVATDVAVPGTGLQVSLTHEAAEGGHLGGNIVLKGHIVAAGGRAGAVYVKGEVPSFGVLQVSFGLHLIGIEALGNVEPLLKAFGGQQLVFCHRQQHLGVFFRIEAAVVHAVTEQGAFLVTLTVGTVLGHGMSAGVHFPVDAQTPVKVIGDEHRLAGAFQEIDIAVVVVVSQIVGIAQEVGHRRKPQEVVHIHHTGEAFFGNVSVVQGVDHGVQIFVGGGFFVGLDVVDIEFALVLVLCTDADVKICIYISVFSRNTA